MVVIALPLRAKWLVLYEFYGANTVLSLSMALYTKSGVMSPLFFGLVITLKSVKPYVRGNSQVLLSKLRIARRGL